MLDICWLFVGYLSIIVYLKDTVDDIVGDDSRGSHPTKLFLCYEPVLIGIKDSEKSVILELKNTIYVLSYIPLAYQPVAIDIMCCKNYRNAMTHTFCQWRSLAESTCEKNIDSDLLFIVMIYHVFFTIILHESLVVNFSLFNDFQE